MSHPLRQRCVALGSLSQMSEWPTQHVVATKGWKRERDDTAWRSDSRNPVQVLAAVLAELIASAMVHERRKRRRAGRDPQDHDLPSLGGQGTAGRRGPRGRRRRADRRPGDRRHRRRMRTLARAVTVPYPPTRVRRPCVRSLPRRRGRHSWPPLMSRFWAARRTEVGPTPIEHAMARKQSPATTDPSELTKYIAAPIYYQLLMSDEPRTQATAPSSRGSAHRRPRLARPTHPRLRTPGPGRHAPEPWGRRSRILRSNPCSSWAGVAGRSVRTLVAAAGRRPGSPRPLTCGASSTRVEMHASRNVSSVVARGSPATLEEWALAAAVVF